MRKSGARIAAYDGLVFSTELGKVIRERRRQRGLSQMATAEASNGAFNQNWLSKVETGEYLTISDDKMQAVAGVLDIPVTELQAAQERMVRLANAQLGKNWAVGMNPIQDLMTIVPQLDRADVRVLVRVARAMLYGKDLRERHGDDAQPIADDDYQAGVHYGTGFGR